MAEEMKYVQSQRQISCVFHCVCVCVRWQLCVDSLAGLVGARLKDGGDGVSIADGAEVFFTGWLRDKKGNRGFSRCSLGGSICVSEVLTDVQSDTSLQSVQ